MPQKRSNMNDNYERTFTPPPEVLSAPATVGYVLEQIAGDLRKHTAEDADMHRDMWNGITRVDLKTDGLDKKVDRMYGGMALMAALLIVLMPIIYFAFKGVVSEELDKRFPDMMSKRVQAQKASQKEGAKIAAQPSVPIEQASIPWSMIPSARANSK
jgi:hypothetical protein